jgi:hypothetical protein
MICVCVLLKRFENDIIEPNVYVHLYALFTP